MIIAALIGFGVGYILAIPPGPVGVTAMKLSLDKGKKQGYLFASGNGVLDFLYCLLAVILSKALVDTLDDFTGEHPIIMFLIQLFIVSGIFIFGFINVRKKAHTEEEGRIKKTKFSEIFDKLAHKGPFLLGIAIALTNIPNPTYFPSLVAMSGFILNLSLFENALLNHVFFALGFGFGNTVWLITLVKVLSHYKARFSDETLTKIHRFAGFTLIGFGTILSYHIYTITKWANIFHLVFAF